MGERFTERRFAGESDLAALVSLAEAAWRPHRMPYANLHVGDFCWRLRDQEYEASLYLWETRGELAGFAEWIAADATLDIQIHPKFVGRLEPQILDWAEAQCAGRPVTTSAADVDVAWNALLAERGYVRRERQIDHFFRSLSDATIESPKLPPGYQVRSLRGEEEIAARVEGHRRGWESTKMTEERYRRLMRSPGYRREFDISVVTDDGEFVATTNMWLDTNGAGLFEPFSTAPEHRRRGLGRAIIAHGLRLLQDAGANCAWIATGSDNVAAHGLYRSAGFAIVRSDRDYAQA